MDQPGKRPGFFSRNIVMVVMLPGIALMHWGWLLLQDTPAAKSHPSARLRTGEAKLPTTEMYEKIKNYYFGDSKGHSKGDSKP